MHGNDAPRGQPTPHAKEIEATFVRYGHRVTRVDHAVTFHGSTGATLF